MLDMMIIYNVRETVRLFFTSINEDPILEIPDNSILRITDNLYLVKAVYNNLHVIHGIAYLESPQMRPGDLYLSAVSMYFLVTSRFDRMMEAHKSEYPHVIGV